MKKIINRAICLAASTSLLCAAALANPVKVGKSTDGIQARVKTETLGLMKLPKGSIKFDGNKVIVGAVPDWLFDRHVVLTGKLIEHHITTAGGKTSVEGLVYFLDGDWINSFPKIKQSDNLEMADGSVLVGNVRTAAPDTGIDFQVSSGQTRRVKWNEIKSLTSPRAFTFSIPCTGVKLDSATGDLAGEAEIISLDPTLTSKPRKILFAKKVDKPAEPKSTLAGSEGGVTKGQLAGMIMLDAAQTLAPAVLAPIIAPLGANGAQKQLRNEQIKELTSGNTDPGPR